MLSIGQVTITFIINFISALLILGLGFFVLHRNARSEIHQLFTLQTLSLALWIFSSAFSDIVRDPEQARFLANMAIIGPFFFIATLYIFAQKFPHERFKMKKLHLFLIFLPIMLAWPFFFTRFNVESVTIRPWGTEFVPGHLYTYLGLYILIGFFMTVREIIKKLIAIREQEVKMQLYYLLFAIGLTIVFGTLANLVLPLTGFSRASVIGPSSTLFFVVFTSYAIVKHHLLDVKVIAAEFFGSGLVLLAFFQIFDSETAMEYMLRIATFATALVFAVLLVRSVIKEVEQRRQLEDLTGQLQNANKRLRKLDDLKTTMVSIASHQLRGPLGGMKGYFTMFRDGDLGPLTGKQKEVVKMNLNTLSRLMNAVETFLDITKLEAGKMTLRKEVLPLDIAVREVAHEFEIMIRRKGLDLKTDIEKDLWVKFDPEKIKHVIFNLIDNAMKYTEEGSITVALEKENGEAVIRVSDTGKGIPPEDLPRLFGKFERGELVVDRGGSGLGLYVVKMLTEMQGGEVAVSSPGAGKGATFTVRLPLTKAA